MLRDVAYMNILHTLFEKISRAELGRWLISPRTGKPITGQAVGKWKRVPAEYVLAIESILDGELTRHDLRPDLYPRETNINQPVCMRNGTIGDNNETRSDYAHNNTDNENTDNEGISDG